jgi:hypothetical protein
MSDLKSITREGVTIPANHSFAAVNEFVHGDVHFEDLQWAMLGLTNDRERIVKAGESLAAYFRAHGINPSGLAAWDAALANDQAEPASPNE